MHPGCFYPLTAARFLLSCGCFGAAQSSLGLGGCRGDSRRYFLCLSLKQRQKVSEVQPDPQSLEPARECGSPWRGTLLGATSMVGSPDWDQGAGPWVWTCHCSWPRMEAPASLSSWSKEGQRRIHPCESCGGLRGCGLGVLGTATPTWGQTGPRATGVALMSPLG